MHTNKIKSLIWVIASVTAGTALYILLLTHWTYWWHILQHWIQGTSLKNFQFWILAVSIIFDLVLIFKLIASYGMFKLKSWGRTLALYVLSVDFLIRLAGFINVLTYPRRHPEMIQRFNEMKSMPGWRVVAMRSLIPSCVIGLLSLISVIILMIKPVRNAFKRIGLEANKSENAREAATDRQG
jgi:hypothetical protein